MMMALFDQETQDRLRDNAKKTEGAWDTVFALVRKNAITNNIGAEQLGVSLSEFDKKYKDFCLTGC